MWDSGFGIGAGVVRVGVCDGTVCKPGQVRLCGVCGSLGLGFTVYAGVSGVLGL